MIVRRKRPLPGATPVRRRRRPPVGNVRNEHDDRAWSRARTPASQQDRIRIMGVSARAARHRPAQPPPAGVRVEPRLVPARGPRDRPNARSFDEQALRWDPKRLPYRLLRGPVRLAKKERHGTNTGLDWNPARSITRPHVVATRHKRHPTRGAARKSRPTAPQK